MATIQVNEDYRVSSDVNSWAIQKRGLRKGKIEWAPVSWFMTLDKAMAGLAARMVRESDGENIDEIVADAKLIGEEINKALAVNQETINLLDGKR